MLGKRSPQLGLFDSDHLCLEFVGRETFYGFLAAQHGQIFRDEEFAALYCPDNGRASVPPSLLATALLLQTYDNASDEEATARAAFDLRWKAALGIGLDARPFGLNLHDVGLGWDRDQAVANALTIFEREFSGNWGPRMEDAFRYGLNTLYEVNIALCAAGERDRQYIILHLPALLTDADFQRALYPRITDPFSKVWWDTYFHPLDRRFQLEVINPVQTKVQRFAGTRIARNIVGQARSTIDSRAWIREAKIVIVNPAKGTVGYNTAALLGGTVFNLVALAIAEQAGLQPRDRRSASLLADELHCVPGADFETILAEGAKFGASLVLATQSLARLDALDHEHKRALWATVFANLDGLFAFHCSAEDARYLVPELGEGVAENDLVALGEHPPTFSVRLDPPLEGDPFLAEDLARESALLYARNRDAVEDELRAAIERIARAGASHDNADGENGFPGASGTSEKSGDEPAKGTWKARNQNRGRGKRSDDSRQSSFLPPSPNAPPAESHWTSCQRGEGSNGNV